MVFAIILDQCNILYAIYGAQAICKFQIRVFAEYLYRHFGAILAHGLGLYHKFAAAKGTNDIVFCVCTKIVNDSNLHSAFGLPVVEKEDHPDHDNGCYKAQCVHTGTGCNAGSDRPEQV